MDTIMEHYNNLATNKLLRNIHFNVLRDDKLQPPWKLTWTEEQLKGWSHMRRWTSDARFNEQLFCGNNVSSNVRHFLGALSIFN
jgi:hypothetical protein